MWPVLAFLLVGFLVGNLAALSATSVVISLIGLLFGLTGGSVIAFQHKLSGADRTAAAQLLAAMSLGCLLGVYAGIVVVERQLLSPRQVVQAPLRRTTDTAESDSARIKSSAIPNAMQRAQNYYLRNALSRKADEIDARYRQGELTAEAAYEELNRQVTALTADTVP